METTSTQPTMWQRSTTRRFLRWLFSWRTIRRALIALVSLITLITLFYTVEDWRGKHAWEAYKRKWEAKGEKFTLSQLAPPPVPDDQNFAMTPLLKPLFDYTHGSNGIVWPDTNGLARLYRLNAELSVGHPINDHLVLGSLEKGTFTDLPACWKFYRGNTHYPQPATPGTAAENILFALRKFEPDIEELREAAATRPDSRFPIPYDTEPPMTILLVHLVPLKAICKLTQVRAVAELELGQSAKALGEMKLGFKLSDSIRNDPILIDHLVRIAMLNLDLQTLREGLVRHAWTDAQLADVEKHVASLNLLAEYKVAMRGERACSTGGIDWLRQQGFWRISAGAQALGFGKPGFFRLMPSGWYYQNMLTISKMFQQFNLPMVDAKAHRVFPDIADMANSQSNKNKMRSRPYNLFARIFMPALSGASRRSACAQTFVDAACVACGLERYRLANGKLPEALDALTPHFIPSIPTDVIDGKPLRYHLKSDGSYVLYSIGWNQTDDGGVIGFSKNGKAVDLTKGDWVWQMPGK